MFGEYCQLQRCSRESGFKSPLRRASLDDLPSNERYRRYPITSALSPGFALIQPVFRTRLRSELSAASNLALANGDEIVLGGAASIRGIPPANGIERRFEATWITTALSCHDPDRNVPQFIGSYGARNRGR